MSPTRISRVFSGEKVKTFSTGFGRVGARLFPIHSSILRQFERTFRLICQSVVAQVTKRAEVSGFTAYNSFTMNDIAKKYMCLQHPQTGRGSKGIYLFLSSEERRV